MMKNKVFVWDLPVRLFHWLLVIAIGIAWYTSEGERGLIELHLNTGYFIIGLILFRISWGFLGTTYAKFSQFIPNKKTLVNYLHTNDKNMEPLGHNPVGALMVVIMLTLLILQATSGLFMNDDIFTAGPYYDSVSKATQQAMSLIHRNAFDCILILSAIHISAITYYLLIKKVNLIIPMITGYKLSTSNKFKGITSSKLLIAIIISMVIMVFLYWLLVLNIPIEEEYYY